MLVPTFNQGTTTLPVIQLTSECVLIVIDNIDCDFWLIVSMASVDRSYLASSCSVDNFITTTPIQIKQQKYDSLLSC